MVHLNLFVWAWRQNFAGKDVTDGVETLKGPYPMRRATPDEEAVWYDQEKSKTSFNEFDPWFDKYLSPGLDPVVTRTDRYDLPRRKKSMFELPLHVTKSQQHVNRLGNSWECGSLNKF